MTFRDASDDDAALVATMLGRVPAGRFAVVVRRENGQPVVIENEPHWRDGTPMPTLYWLVDPELHAAVSHIESDGGVHRYENLVDSSALVATHDAYAQRRASATVRHDLAQPSGGVGGTRQGIKCLHAHVANFLVGHDDPVGELVANQLSLPPLMLQEVR